MSHPALIVQEVFHHSDEAERSQVLRQLAEAWLRTAADQIRP